MDGQLTSILIIIMSSLVGAFFGVLLKDACDSLIHKWRNYRAAKRYGFKTVRLDKDVFGGNDYDRSYSVERYSQSPSIPQSVEDSGGTDYLDIPRFKRKLRDRTVSAFDVSENESDDETSKLIQDALSTLSPGIVLFNPPAVVTVGIPERIEVRIAKKPLESLLENLKGRGARKTEAIKVSDLMKVSLTGSSFLINARSSEEQLISDSEYTEWSWDLVPLKAGPQKLNLKITVAIILPGIKEQRDHPVMEKNILVKSNLRYSVNEFGTKNWQWIAGTLLIPVAVYLWTALSG